MKFAWRIVTRTFDQDAAEIFWAGGKTGGWAKIREVAAENEGRNAERFEETSFRD